MQTSYAETPSEGFPGLISDTGYRDVISRLNAAMQTWTMLVVTAANAEVFRVTIDGTNYDYTSDGSGTKPEITAGLKVLIDAGSDDVTVADDTTDTLTIENNDRETEMTISTTDPATGRMTLTETIDFEDAIQFGAVVVEDSGSASADTGKRESCRLPNVAADFSGRHVLGVAIADASLITRTSAPYGGYEPGTAVPILRRGRIWMYVEDVATVANGGLVYVRHIATGTEQLGNIRAADDGSDTEVLDRDQAQFTGKKVTADDLAEVEWNLP